MENGDSTPMAHLEVWMKRAPIRLLFPVLQLCLALVVQSSTPIITAQNLLRPPPPCTSCSSPPAAAAGSPRRAPPPCEVQGIEVLYFRPSPLLGYKTALQETKPRWRQRAVLFPCPKQLHVRKYRNPSGLCTAADKTDTGQQSVPDRYHWSAKGTEPHRSLVADHENLGANPDNTRPCCGSQLLLLRAPPSTARKRAGRVGGEEEASKL